MEKISPSLLLTLGIGFFSPLLQSITQVPAAKTAFGILGIVLIFIALCFDGVRTKKAGPREIVEWSRILRYKKTLPFIKETAVIAASILVLLLGSIPFPASRSNANGLLDAIDRSAEMMTRDLPAGTRVAIVAF